MTYSVAVWPALGTEVTLEDLTVIDVDGATVVATKQVLDFIRTGELLTYDPTEVASSAPEAAGSGHASQHILGGTQEIDGDRLAIDFEPNFYTQRTTPEATDDRHLATHLSGLEYFTSNHSSRHSRSGGDAIDGDTIDVDYSPSNYTRTTASGLTTSTEELTSHLKGIDSALGTNATAASTAQTTANTAVTNAATAQSRADDHDARHLRGGADEIDGDQLDIDYSPTNYTRAATTAVSSSTEHLAGHLSGIDTALGTVSTTANTHASRHVRGGADQVDGDVIDVDFTPTYYTSTTVGGLTTSTEELTSHLKGIDTAIGAVKKSNVYEFWHLGQNGGSTTRRMFSGNLLAAQYATATHGNSVRRIIPYAGNLKRITVQNPVATSGGTNTVTYTVLKSSNGGSSWSSTSLACAVLASNTTVTSADSTVSVAAGDLIVIEVTFSGAVTAIASGEYMAACVVYEY